MEVIKYGLFLFFVCTQIACQSPSLHSSEYTIYHYLKASEDNNIAKWRQQLAIPKDALIAIYPDGQYSIIEPVTDIRGVPPSLSPYVNDFVDCYLNMAGVFHQQSVILQAPCTRRPIRNLFGREEE